MKQNAQSLIWQTIRLADIPATPWKNGGGLTQELLTLPSIGDWCIRVSVAQISQSGAFSSYAGVQRWFAVLHGAGVRLMCDGHEYVLKTSSAPFEFDGASSVHADLLGGETSDLNLMTRGLKAKMQRVCSENFTSIEISDTTNFIAVYAYSTIGFGIFNDGKQSFSPFSLTFLQLEGDLPVHSLQLQGENLIVMTAEGSDR